MEPDTSKPFFALQGGLARAASLSDRKRKMIAKKAPQTRWARKYFPFINYLRAVNFLAPISGKVYTSAIDGL